MAASLDGHSLNPKPYVYTWAPQNQTRSVATGGHEAEGAWVHPNKILLKVTQEEENMLCRDYTGILFPYSLLSPRRQFELLICLLSTDLGRPMRS